MKIQIRRGVFETNSSSVHSCAITSKSTYDALTDGTVWYKENSDAYDWKKSGYGEYLPVEDAIEKNIEFLKEKLITDFDLNEESVNNFIDEYRNCKNISEAFYNVGLVEFYEEDFRYDVDWTELFVSWDEFWEIHEYEDWKKEFTLPGLNDAYVAWGYVGSDR